MTPLCRQCGRSVSRPRHLAIELCESCASCIAVEVQARVLTMQDALRTLPTVADLSARLELCDRILQEAEALSRYEARGILTTAPPPSTLLVDFRAKREAVELTIAGAGKASGSRQGQEPR